MLEIFHLFVAISFNFLYFFFNFNLAISILKIRSLSVKFKSLLTGPNILVTSQLKILNSNCENIILIFIGSLENLQPHQKIRKIIIILEIVIIQTILSVLCVLALSLLVFYVGDHFCVLLDKFQENGVVQVRNQSSYLEITGLVVGLAQRGGDSEFLRASQRTGYQIFLL